MEFVTVRDFRTSPAVIWRKLPVEREMVITNNGKPIALLTPLTDETLEETISTFRQARAIQAVRKMQETSSSLGNNKMTLDEINAVIKEAREEMRTENESCN